MNGLAIEYYLRNTIFKIYNTISLQFTVEHLAQESRAFREMTRARINMRRGDIFELISKWNKAERIYEKNIRTLPDKLTIAENACSLAELKRRKAQFKRMSALLNTARRTFNSFSYEKGIIEVMKIKGAYYWNLGDISGAMKCRNMKLKYFLCEFLGNISQLYLTLNRIQEAEKANNEAYKIAKQIKRGDVIFRSTVLKGKILVVRSKKQGVRDIKRNLY